VERRSPLTDLAGLGLLAWAILLAYVSVSPLLSGDLSSDGGISALGALLAAAHIAAAFGVMRREAWGRSLALAMGAIGLFGSGVVLLTLAGSLVGRGVDSVGGFPGLPLAVPAGMVIVYGLIVVILLRAGREFTRG
jgi:hypothetical protein